MSSGTPRLSRPGSPAFRRWLRAGFIPHRHGLGFCVLAAAGAGLLLALAAPLLSPCSAPPGGRAEFRERAATPRSAAAGAGGGVITSQGPPGPGPGPSSGQHLILAAVVLLVLMADVALPASPPPAGHQAAGPGHPAAGGRLVRDPHRGAVPTLAPRQWPGVSLQRLRARLADPAAARDLLWLVINACGGWILAALPAGLIVGR